jgi:hypothetical protein
MRRSDTTLPGISRIPVSIRAPARGAILVAAVLVASGLLWAVMFFGSLAHLTRLAGGLTPFDIRPWGYSYADARAFLAASARKAEPTTPAQN